MYNASAQFHTAVFQGSPTERVLFKFADGTIFTNEDINLTRGIKLTEAANLDEELTIGACPSSTLEATIMNYHSLLNGYAFGECEALLGILTETIKGSAIDANVTAFIGGNVRIDGYLTAPYIKVDGVAPTAQPTFPVQSILVVGDMVYCFSATGDVWTAHWVGDVWDDLSASVWDDLSTMTWDDFRGVLTAQTSATYNAFMVAKFTQWAQNRRGMSYNSEVLYEYYPNGTVEKYEYVKLGTFIIDTPKKRKTDLIVLTAYDRMTLFDIDATAFWAGLTYPVTLGSIFAQLCAYVGVTAATTTFTNSTREYTAAPAGLENVTAREMLKWIAEASCTYARMTRDGEVELMWFGTESVAIPMTQYFSIELSEYEVAQINKLQILGAETDIGVIIGTGTNAYQILDNPFLYGATDTEIRTYGTPIYNKLAAYAAFKPITARAVCDWSIQAGDIISIVLDGVTYSLPVYRQTITWNGAAKVVYESTGAANRPVNTATNRRVFAQNKSMYLLETTVDGLNSTVVSLSGTVSSQQSSITQNASKIALVVETVEGTNTIKAASIIAAVNADESALTFAADKISLEGLITANSYFKINLDGSIEVNAGTIGGFTIDGDALDSAYLRIDPSSGMIQVGDWYFSPNGLEFGSTVSPYFDFEYSGGVSKIAGTAPMQVGPYTNGIVNSLTLVGTTVKIYATSSAYNCIFDDNAGQYNDITFRPSVANTGNIGSGTYYWNQVVGNYIRYYNLNNLSSRKYKENIRYFTDDDYDAFDDLNPVIYNYINGPDKALTVGLIAEDVYPLYPWAVALDEHGEADSLDYTKFIPLLIYELQKLRKRVVALEGGIINV